MITSCESVGTSFKEGGTSLKDVPPSLKFGGTSFKQVTAVG
ncbi:hypothetical protein [Sphingobacterium faecium]